MISWRQLTAELIADHALRLRMLAGGMVSLLAVALGFLLPSVIYAEQALRRLGYYIMLAAFGGFGVSIWSLRQSAGAFFSELGQRRERGVITVVFAFALAFVAVGEPWGFKVVSDEFVLQATALNLHLEREPAPLVRAHYIDGVFTPLVAYVDKRPFAFAFLLSLVHNATGYRIENAFVLNNALAVVSLVLVFVLARRLGGGDFGALASVVLWASLPLFVQNANGSGMELLNVTLLALAMLLGWEYLTRPDEAKARALVFTSVLLAQTRYESALFVAVAAFVIVAGWRRAGRPIVPWALICAPLLLLPYAWHYSVTSASKALWELRPGEESRFALEYLMRNLRAAAHFYFDWENRAIANSWLLSGIGVVALVGVVSGRRAWDCLRTLAPTMSVAAYGAGVLLNLLVVFCYYWGALNDPVVARLSLPSLFVAVLATSWLLGRVAPRIDPRWALAVAVFYAVGWMRPQTANRFYTEFNTAVRQMTWEKGVIHARPPCLRFIITNKSALAWIIEQEPALTLAQARMRREELRFHLHAQTFGEIVVMQKLVPAREDGGFLVDPDDELPPDFKLETVAEKRFGVALARISRLIAVGPTSGDENSGS